MICAGLEDAFATCICVLEVFFLIFPLLIRTLNRSPFLIQIHGSNGLVFVCQTLNQQLDFSFHDNVGSTDTTLKLWKGKTCLHTFAGHSGWVFPLLFFPTCLVAHLLYVYVYL